MKKGQSGQSDTHAVFGGTCLRCEKFGHRASECRSWFKKDGTPLPGNGQSHALGGMGTNKYPQAMAVSTSSVQPPAEVLGSTWPWQNPE